MKLLTWREAAQELGWGDSRAAGLRLQHAVLTQERLKRIRIATRVQPRGTGCKPHCRITLSALRRHLPELKASAVDELSRNLRKHLTELDRRIAARCTEHINAKLEPRLKELWDRDEQLAQAITELSKRLRRLT